MEILYQGHGSIRVQSDQGVVLYLDPCAGEGYDLPADIILITHQHGDHNQVQLVTMKDDVEIFSPSLMIQHGEYRSIEIKGYTITSVPAYNRYHPKEECVGYVVIVDGLRIYFAGDTSQIPEMDNLRKEKINYAFFPGDGFYNMDVKESEYCATIVGADRSVPIHLVPYHGQQGDLFSEEKAERFNPRGSLILRPGDRVIASLVEGGLEEEIVIGDFPAN